MPYSLVKVAKTTGVPTQLCQWSTSDQVQVGAFVSATVFAHFYDAVIPTMETLSIVGLTPGSSSCVTTYV
jgi:hypothetical protein